MDYTGRLQVYDGSGFVQVRKGQACCVGLPRRVLLPRMVSLTLAFALLALIRHFLWTLRRLERYWTKCETMRIHSLI